MPRPVSPWAYNVGMPLVWGDIATWTTAAVAASALGALGAAALANVRTRQLLSIESSRRADEKRTTEAGQASLVSAWVPVSPFDRDGHQSLTQPALVFPDVMIANRSQVPVYEVRLLVWSGQPPCPSLDVSADIAGV